MMAQGDMVTCGTTYLVAVPAGNALVSTNVREALDGSLCLPAVAGDEAVGTIRAGDDVHGAVGVIIASVVADSDGGSHAGEREDGSGELHGDDVGLVIGLWGGLY